MIQKGTQKSCPARSQANQNRRCAFPHPPVPELPRQLVSRVGYVEDFDEPRTPHGERRVTARWGWAGEKGDFFSILLEDHSNRRTTQIQRGPIDPINGRVAIALDRTVLVQPCLKREVEPDRFGFQRA